MTYRVHIFAVVRVPVEVEAISAADAVDLASWSVNLEDLAARIDEGAEFAHEVSHYAVDELFPDGDPKCVPPEWFNAQGKPDPSIGDGRKEIAR